MIDREQGQFVEKPKLSEAIFREDVHILDTARLDRVDSFGVFRHRAAMLVGARRRGKRDKAKNNSDHAENDGQAAENSRFHGILRTGLTDAIRRCRRPFVR
jgi:hypothetical protein